MDTRERIKFRIGFSRMEKKYEWKDHVIFMGLLLVLLGELWNTDQRPLYG
ncbi:MAG: hypothetical protein ACLUV8_02555 [Clostridium sp.]